MTASRRPAARAIAALVTVSLALAACGGSGDGGDTGVGDNAEVEGAADGTDGTSEEGGDAAAFPVTIEHEFGETTIEAEPTRVVTAGFNEQDDVLALGVVPVGARDYLDYDEEDRPWAADLLVDGPPEQVGGMELDYELIAALEPDLIVATYAFIDADGYELLSAIAPTISQPAGYDPGGIPWEEQTRIIGEALGRSDLAEERIAEVETLFADARDAHPQFEGATLAVDFVLAPDQHYVLPEQDRRFRFFEDLGFSAPETTGELSLEQLELLDQDVLIVGGAARGDFDDEPLLAGLDVVVDGRTVYLGGFDTDHAAALGFGSVLSLPYALEQLVPPLADAADGDPGTEVVDPGTG